MNANPTTKTSSNNAQLGYVLHKLIATPAGGTYTVTAPEIGRYCMAGGKPAFSYDERWMIFHHYVANSDDARANISQLGFLRHGAETQVFHERFKIPVAVQ